MAAKEDSHGEKKKNPDRQEKHQRVRAQRFTHKRGNEDPRRQVKPRGNVTQRNGENYRRQKGLNALEIERDVHRGRIVKIGQRQKQEHSIKRPEFPMEHPPTRCHLAPNNPPGRQGSRGQQVPRSPVLFMAETVGRVGDDEQRRQEDRGEGHRVRPIYNLEMRRPARWAPG